MCPSKVPFTSREMTTSFLSPSKTFSPQFDTQKLFSVFKFFAVAFKSSLVKAKHRRPSLLGNDGLSSRRSVKLYVGCGMFAPSFKRGVYGASGKGFIDNTFPP
jgi:hypothetical protein